MGRTKNMQIFQKTLKLLSQQFTEVNQGHRRNK